MVDPAEFKKKYLAWNRKGVATGEPAEEEHGVVYEALWEVEGHGLCDHARRTARALAETGVPLLLRSPRRGVSQEKKFNVIESKAYDEVSPWLTPSFSQAVARIHHIEPVAGALERLRPHELIPSELAARMDQRRVVYAVWERRGLGDVELDVLKRFGQVWTACHANALMLEENGIERERIRVVPVPHWPDDPLLQHRPERYKGPVRFYQIAKWEPRKENHRLVGAFLREFRPGEAQLYLKTTAAGPRVDDYPASAHHSFTQWLGDDEVEKNGWTLEAINRDVRLIDEVVSRKLIVQLHHQSDVYVSCSHGEGWDLPAYEAKLAGNFLVYTPSGGPQSYAGVCDPVVGPVRLVDCHPWYRWTGKWLDYAIEALQLSMREAFDAVVTGRRGLKDMSEFRAEQVGARMREHIEELVDGSPW